MQETFYVDFPEPKVHNDQTETRATKIPKPTFLVEIESTRHGTWVAAVDNAGKEIKTTSAIKAGKEVAKLRAQGFKARAWCKEWDPPR